jgi:hypothetical protein
MQVFVLGFPKFGLIIVYLSRPLSGADEVSGYSWQLIAAVCDECEGLTLCE